MSTIKKALSCAFIVATFSVMAKTAHANEWGPWRDFGNGFFGGRTMCLEETQKNGKAQWNIELKVTDKFQDAGFTYTVTDKRGTSYSGHVFLHAGESTVFGQYFKLLCGADSGIGIEITPD